MTANEAANLLPFEQQKEILLKIDKTLIQNKPNELLRIDVKKVN